MPDITRTSLPFEATYLDPGTASIGNMAALQWSSSWIFSVNPDLKNDILQIDRIDGMRVRVNASRTNNSAVNPTLYIGLGKYVTGSFSGITRSTAVSTISSASYSFGGSTDNWSISDGKYLWNMAQGQFFAIQVFGRNNDTFYNCGISPSIVDLTVWFTHRGQPGMLAFSL